MYLKSLELCGFKSFSEKTTLCFDSQLTVIVGPNGSGKSNITDAMRWVLGELSSKSIRGMKMEDVIFVGTDTRKPMGYAEVSVTFDNTGETGRLNSPYDEITVTRRYYRAGESEYLINKKPVRLRDIYELFMNTGIGREGYSIIGQGQIAEIISKKSEERRNIFEEAAGISKFKYKKTEAEKRLAETEDNMLRAEDILSELRGRIAPLEKDAARARQYLELFEAKKQADVSLWLYDSEHLRVMTAEAERSCTLSGHALEMCEDTIAQLEERNDRLFGASQNQKLKAEKRYSALKERNQALSELEAAYRVLCNDAEHCEVSITAEERNQEKISELLTRLDAERREKEEHLNTIERQLSAYEAREAEDDAALCAAEVEDEAMRRTLTEQLDRQRQLEAEAVDLRVRISVLENARRSDGEKNETVADDIAKYETQSAELTQKLENAAASVHTYEEAGVRLEEKLRQREQEIRSADAEISRLRGEENALSGQLQALDERISALRRMEEHFDGYQSSVRFLMKKSEAGEFPARAGQIYGPLSRLLTVDAAHILAVETALGASLQNIIVESEETAKAAIGVLKAANAGRATFYPLTSVRFQGRTQEVKQASQYTGFVGYADELARCEERFHEILLSLLGRTAVFDTIDHASEMAKALQYKVRAVTLDGQQINIGGSFTGGSAKRDSGMLTRANEIAQLEESRCTVAGDVAKRAQERECAERARVDMEKQKQTDEAQRLMTDSLLRAERAQYDGFAAKREVNDNLLLSLREDLRRLGELRDRSATEIQRLTDDATRVSEEAALVAQARHALETERYTLEERRKALAETRNAGRIVFAEYRKDREAAQAAVLETGERQRIALAEQSESTAKLETERTRLAKLEIETRENRAAHLKAASEIARLEEERAKLEAGGMEYEQKLNALRIQIRESSAKKDTLFRAHTKNEAKLVQLRGDFDKMTSRLWDEYELTHTTAAALGYPPVTDETRAAVAASLGSYRNRLKALGPVNVGAIDEYTEVKGRFDFLDQQMTDLQKSKTDLTKIISGLEQEMKASFTETFQKINENFGEVFRQLFGGGHGELSLTDPDNVLTSGIEIKAAPPGKMIKSLLLLSGGEQAFVAIALLFAVLKVNPAPFCIFDEIEAALDEVNVIRFGEYIKRYADQTQFIIITHRRGTMEIAETLYGVTMPERGVSRVLSMDLHMADAAGKQDTITSMQQE